MLRCGFNSRLSPTRRVATKLLEYGVAVDATESYRWAMYKSPHGFGCNAQTLPKYLRYYVTAPPGRVFAAGDLSQAEARVVAYESCCVDLIDLFNNPKRHVHLENAIATFGHAVEKDTPEYTLAKAVVHACNYREGPGRFSSQTGLPVAEVRRLLANYHKARPEVRQWHTRVWNEIKSTGKLTTPLLDERLFYEAIGCFSLTGKMTDQHWKDAISWVPQSTVPHVLNLGLIEFAKARRNGMDLWFHHQGHDSYAVSVPDDSLCQREFMELSKSVYDAIPLRAHGATYRIPLEPGMGYNLGENIPWDGSSITRPQWEKWVESKLTKRSRAQQIVDGIYGVHLRSWRA